MCVCARAQLSLDYGASGGLQERQKHLRECFAFDCTCERCRQEQAQEQQQQQQQQASSSSSSGANRKLGGMSGYGSGRERQGAKGGGARQQRAVRAQSSGHNQ